MRKRSSRRLAWMAALIVIPGIVVASEGTNQSAQSQPARQEDKKEKSAGQPLEVVWKDGFILRSADKKNELRLAASVQLDSRFYTGGSYAPDSFDIRRARLDFNAKMHDFVTVRIQAAMEDSPYIRNAYADLGRAGAFNLRIGQMKVPFSTQWLTLDNQVDFLERGSAEPIYPFFDRGIMAWGNVAGKRLTYNLGIYNGTGVDADTTKGDIDDHKDLAWRLFAQPFTESSTEVLRGLVFVVEGTHGLTSVPTRRYETRGLMAADFESLIWRWRTEQVIGTDGRNTDQISGQIDQRTRWGGEVNYLRGPFTCSVELLRVRCDDVQIYHDFYQGSRRLKHDPVFSRGGAVDSFSIWGSYFLTGESKTLDNFGWRQPSPKRPFGPGLRGLGALEVLGRFSSTITDDALFDSTRVGGFTAADFPGAVPPLPGEGSSVTAAVLDGARKVYESSVGLNWTMNYNVRVQLDYIRVWAPDFTNGSGGILSGGNSDQADATVKYTPVESENLFGFRVIIRI